MVSIEDTDHHLAGVEEGMGTPDDPWELSLYQYQPFQRSTCIRVLTLFPSKSPSSRIDVRLSITPLVDAPIYEALSYTWATSDGDSSMSSHVTCGGRSIRITRNCEELLQTLRREDSERVVWIDAICIDQANLEERCDQMTLMGSIYRQASQVVIWLGHESEAIDPNSGVPISRLCMDHLTALAAQIRECGSRRKSRFSLPLYKTLTSQAADYVTHGKCSPLIEGFLDVILRQWWVRVWVVQEAALARSGIVICGERTVSYSDIYTCFTTLYKDDSHHGGLTWSLFDGCKSHVLAVYYVKELVKKVGPARAFRKLMSRSRRLQATDARDHIFATLDTFGPFKSDLPVPDYSRSAPEVFSKVAESLIRLLDSLEILVEATNVDDDADLPSWVPDFSQRPQFHMPVHGEVYGAGAGTKPSYSISSCGKELRLLGKCFDVLAFQPKADLSSYKNPYIASKGILGYQQSCTVGLSLEGYPTGENVQEVVWRTLCWNVDVNAKFPATDKLAVSFEKFHQALFSGEDMETIERELLSAGAAGFNDICVHSMPLGVTSERYLVSAPWTAQEGDLIVVFSGAQVPFVLRRKAVGDHYSLIGACYVHGIMNGEAFPQDPDELEWFVIR